MSGPTGEWRILNAGRRIRRDDWSLALADLIWPYHVTGPDGRLITITATLWGARRIIDREKAKRATPEREPDNWWDSPIIYREPK